MPDELNLVPATDEEISKEIEKVLDELQEEIDKEFSDETLEREYGDFMKEFSKAKTVEERTKVMDKYNVKY